MEKKMNRLKIPLNLTYDDVLPYLGLRREAVSPQEQELIDHYLKIIRQIARPQGTWRVFAVATRTPEQITLKEASLSIEGRQTVAHFQNCEQISLLATTLGPDVDDYLPRLSEQSVAEALIFDGVASAAAEYLIEQLDAHHVAEIRRKGFFPTARFSPGYGDWSLHWQKAFLESIDATKIGLSLTPHFLLQPVKSVTAAIGWSSLPIARSYGEPAPSSKPCRSADTCPYCRFAAVCAEQKTNE